MPVIHLRGLAPAGGSAPIEAALTGIADAVHGVVGGDPGDTWCTFTAVDAMSIGTRIVTGDGQILYLDCTISPRGAEVESAVLAAACRAAAAGFAVPIADVWGTLRLVDADRTFAGGAPLG